MTDDEMAAIRARTDAATPGPWVAEGLPYDEEHGDDPVVMSTTAKNARGGSLYIAQTVYDQQSVTYEHAVDADTEFIAHARVDVPALLAEMERLRATIQRAADEARNVLPDLDNDQATAVEQFAALLLR